MGEGRYINESYLNFFIECCEKCSVSPDKVNPYKLIKKYIIYQILSSISSIKTGYLCTAEFGVWKGLTSMMITSLLKECLSKHYIFDSFEGLSEATQEDKIGGRGTITKGMMSPDYHHIQKLFPNSILQKCWIPAQLKRVDVFFDFVHIDLDLYDPILGALEYIIDKANPGCIIIIDDYNTRFPGCIRAIRDHIDKYQNLYRFHYDTMQGNYVLVRN